MCNIMAATMVLFTIAGWWITHSIEGYVLTSTPTPNAESSPFGATVITQIGA